MRDSLVNNEFKLSELEEHLAKERRKLEEAPDEATRNRIAERIKGLEDEMATHRENASGNREALGMIISTIVLALPGGSGGGAAPPQPPQPPSKGGGQRVA